MLEIHTTQRLHQVELGLRAAAERHGGSVLAASHVGQLLGPEHNIGSADAITFTLCFSHLYAALLRADIRCAAFLPSRIAVCAKGDSVFLEAISPRESCRLLGRADVEPLAASLEDALRLVMDEAAHRPPRAADASGMPAAHLSTEDQVNMKATLPQRVDCRGTKLEELAGTGQHDSQGG